MEGEKKMEKVFNLAEDSRILIYGCGNLGKNIADQLLNKKYNIVAFVDRNALQIVKWNDIPVISISKMKGIDELEDYVILVALNNGMSHDQVALDLYKHGARKIIYSPMYVRFNYEQRKVMRRIYRYLCNYDFELIKNVPLYMENNVSTGNSPVIDISKSGNVSFWCAIENLRGVSEMTINQNLTEEYQEYARPILMQYQECKIQEFTPYINLFKWLRGENVDLDSYLRCTGRYQEKKRAVWLEDRKKLYEVYLDALRHDTTFFTDAPSPCIWNSKGYFTFTEGLTRAFFLISEGYSEVPICVSKEDYGAWRRYYSKQH